ncbi:MAG: hydroxymethylbilane synthase [Acidobacteria bacterium]|nr:hydroxymethylbilane synthase [Acidobacteriota bacterium]
MSAAKIRVGTRGSKLALAQARPMVEFLRAQGIEIEWKEFTTSGDKWLAGPLDENRGSGFFTKELEAALLEGDVDLLIHSLKDVALDRPHGIVPACVPTREDPRDVLVLREDAPAFADGCVIGTSSVRRERMLAAAFPGARFTWIRGNVPTRVHRVREGVLRDAPLHGTVLAAAGLRRLDLDLSGLRVRPLEAHELLPAPGQGALLAETREDRPDIVEALKGYEDSVTHRCVLLERAVLRGIGGGCQQPLAAFAEPLGRGRFRLQAAFAGEQGLRRGCAEGSPEEDLPGRVLAEMGLP